MGSSWAADASERDRWITYAGRLEGVQIERVRYFNIDYRRWDVAPEHVGVREITDETEWAEPTFEFPGGHTLDYGLELTGPTGHTWSVTWIPPGVTEGLALHDEPMLPNALSADSSTAMWDVSGGPVGGSWWASRSRASTSSTSRGTAPGVGGAVGSNFVSRVQPSRFWKPKGSRTGRSRRQPTTSSFGSRSPGALAAAASPTPA